MGALWLGVVRRASVGLSDLLVVCRARDDTIVNGVDLVVDLGLSSEMSLVHPNHGVMRRPGALEIGVVAVAQEKLAARRGMSAHPPTPWLVPVVLLHELIHAGADRAKDAELGEIGAESRPEAVVRAGLVIRACVHREPMVNDSGAKQPGRNRGPDQYGHGRD